MTATLERNFRETQEAIATEAKRAGRQPGEIMLLAVTKSVGPQRALELAQLGQTQLGENRLPSLLAKREFFETRGVQAQWHFIGQIQRNKARKVILNSDVLHSVDTLQLIETLDRIAGEESRNVPIYLEVKLTNEELKHGFDPQDLSEAIRQAAAASNLELRGLMTMAQQPDPNGDVDDQYPEFRTLAKLAAEIEGDPQRRNAFANERVELSMGMSGDYPAAIAAGSHVVRIGSALFAGLDSQDDQSGTRQSGTSQ